MRSYRKKTFTIKDDSTGEIVSGYGLIVPKKSFHPYALGGIQVRQESLLIIAKNPNLTKRALRILLYILANVERLGALTLSRSDIGDALAMHKSDVTRGVRELCELSISEPDDGRRVMKSETRRMVLSPSVAWKGRADDLGRALDEERDRAKAEMKGAREDGVRE